MPFENGTLLLCELLMNPSELLDLFNDTEQYKIIGQHLGNSRIHIGGMPDSSKAVLIARMQKDSNLPLLILSKPSRSHKPAEIDALPVCISEIWAVHTTLRVSMRRPFLCSSKPSRSLESSMTVEIRPYF